MPVHHAVERFKLLDEIRRLEEAGMIIRFVLPETITYAPDNMFGIVSHYLIVFDEP